MVIFLIRIKNEYTYYDHIPKMGFEIPDMEEREKIKANLKIVDMIVLFNDM